MAQRKVKTECNEAKHHAACTHDEQTVRRKEAAAPLLAMDAPHVPIEHTQAVHARKDLHLAQQLVLSMAQLLWRTCELEWFGHDDVFHFICWRESEVHGVCPLTLSRHLHLHLHLRLHMHLHLR